jgi:hypothetical protein
MLIFNDINCIHRGTAMARRRPPGLDNDGRDYHSGDCHDLVTQPAPTERPGAIPEQRES